MSICIKSPVCCSIAVETPACVVLRHGNHGGPVTTDLHPRRKSTVGPLRKFVGPEIKKTNLTWHQMTKTMRHIVVEVVGSIHSVCIVVESSFLLSSSV